VKKIRATEAFFVETEDVSYLDPFIFLIQDGFAQNIISIQTQFRVGQNKALNLKILLSDNIHRAFYIQILRSPTHCFSIPVPVYITKYVLSAAQSRE